MCPHDDSPTPSKEFQQMPIFYFPNKCVTDHGKETFNFNIKNKKTACVLLMRLARPSNVSNVSNVSKDCQQIPILYLIMAKFQFQHCFTVLL